ncbi:MAG: hypothetical protein LBQ57_09535, partial [Spirochaetales bacterium]|nr:hypothetical protein [Spirochaetales bacterium]
MRLPESSMAGPFLGALLQGARIPPEVSAEMFEYRRDQIIFTAISDMVKEGVTPDILTLTHYLQSAGKLDEAGGAAYVASLTDNAYIAN